MKASGTDEARDSEEIWMPIYSDNDAQSAIIVPRLFGSTGDQEDSVIPGESDKSRLEEYQDKVQRIQDAIADSDWYANEEPENEDEYDAGDLMTIILALI